VTVKQFAVQQPASSSVFHQRPNAADGDQLDIE